MTGKLVKKSQISCSKIGKAIPKNVDKKQSWYYIRNLKKYIKIEQFNFNDLATNSEEINVTFNDLESMAI